MRRPFETSIRSITYVVLALLFSTPAFAWQAGDQVEGVIAEVDGRTMTVDREGGGRVTARLNPRTQVVVQPRQGGHYPNASPEFLKVGMGVRFRQADGPLDRVHVTAVPAGAWPEAAPPSNAGTVQERPRSAEEQVLKVRITDLGRGGDSFTADVAGSKRVFRVERASLLRSFHTGDLVIVSTNAAGLVVDLRAASLSGRVVSADRRVGRLVVDVDGREQSYAVDDRDLLDDVQAGDRIRFEVEERGAGRPVVTAIF
jgi:hypothetical protein